MATHRITLLSLVLLLTVLLEAAVADVFELTDGDAVIGQLVDRGEKGKYVVRTEAGALVTLTKKQVRKVKHKDKQQLEYEERSRRMPDTVDAHRELAVWCKQARQSKLADHHLSRILELDPNDQQARESLGYQRHQGRWLTRDDIMTARGLVHYKGSYRTPQEISLLERKSRREEAESEWLRDVRRWRDWLDGKRSVEASNMISAIKDPDATVALAGLLKQEKDPQVRDLLISTLAELLHPLATTTLVDVSLDEPERDVRLQCVDYLLRYHSPVSLTPYVKALRSKDNRIVNRAAEALEKLDNPAAISPLIDALVTRHKYSNRNAPPGETNVAFDPSGGGGGLSVGGKSKFVTIDQKNLEVRRALVELSAGQDFEFNEKAWRRWFVNQQAHEFVDTRRDK